MKEAFRPGTDTEKAKEQVLGILARKGDGTVTQAEPLFRSRSRWAAAVIVVAVLVGGALAAVVLNKELRRAAGAMVSKGFSLLLGEKDQAPAQPEPQPVTTNEPAKPPVEEAAPLTPDAPEESVAETVIPEPLAEVVRPFRNPEEKVQSDPEAVHLLATMKEKWGWNKLKTFKCKISITGMNPASTSTPQGVAMRGDMFAEFPDKLLWTVAIEVGVNNMRMYVVSDGKFFQVGSILPDGTKSPWDVKEADPRDQGFTFFNGDRYNPELFQFGKPVRVRIEPNDPAFQTDDGAAPTNLDYIMLPMEYNGRDEYFVDPVSMEVRAIKTYLRDGKVAGYSRVRFGEIAPGIWYPVRMDMTSEAATVEASETPQTQIVNMRTEVSDFEVNSPIDPAVFSFAGGGVK